jgi:membrane protease YdiL (CAAX protease family)
MMYLSFIFLLCSIGAVLVMKDAKQPALALLILAIISGLIFGTVRFVALPSLLAAGVCMWTACAAGVAKPLRSLGLLLFLVLCALLFIHRLPGFSDLLILDNAHFSSDSAPFSMYFNFDKTAAALLIYIFFLSPTQLEALRPKDLGLTALLLAGLVAVALPLTSWAGFVHFDAKIPETLWIWAVNNLFFVCFAEEGLFLGLIQGGLKDRIGQWPALCLGAVLFGAAHSQGGLVYMALGCLAGFFYGLAFLKTNKIQSSILLYFAFNSIHFLLFTYPWLNQPD